MLCTVQYWKGWGLPLWSKIQGHFVHQYWIKTVLTLLSVQRGTRYRQKQNICCWDNYTVLQRARVPLTRQQLRPYTLNPLVFVLLLGMFMSDQRWSSYYNTAHYRMAKLIMIVLLRLPPDDVQHKLQRWSLMNIPRKKDTKRNQKKKKPMYKV